MLTANDIIRLRAPEHYNNADLDKWITMVEVLISKEAFGEQGEIAIALQTLHLMELQKLSNDLSAAGVAADSSRVVKVKEGDMEVQSSSLAANESDLHMTKWGRELDGLIGSCVVIC